jgi:hypothetical protein
MTGQKRQYFWENQMEENKEVDKNEDGRTAFRII